MKQYFCNGKHGICDRWTEQKGALCGGCEYLNGSGGQVVHTCPTAIVFVHEDAIVFDDINDETAEHNVYWVEMCPECLHKHKIPLGWVDSGAGGTCCVQGCWNEAQYYVDLPKDRVTLVKSEHLEYVEGLHKERKRGE